MDPAIRAIEDEFKSRLAAVRTAADAESLRVEFLGRQGKITELLGRIREIPSEERKAFGRDSNALKALAAAAVEEALGRFESTGGPEPYFDESLPGIEPPSGRVHPLTQTIHEITRIFEKLGFETVRGPEIETEFHNFTALNIPLDHPSREGFDTFYTDGGQLLRSQTSTVQIRVMQERKPPLRVLAPGRVYRPDTVDASHSFMFHQVEGLMVDEKTTFSDLKGILHLFLRQLFGRDTKVRFRPHFFPFTEPSVEVDIQWGTKGWLEILGAGCVHPNVFTAVDYDPKRWQGFAFGLGVERIAMLRHGISDIRHFYENDIRFLRQFP
ncbi:MAG: phenylalanine--tRNA ligase subunit alpha [Candidatus Omnitrophota bacterium]|jgi:phenylalanyl-tRNA synthetase alpha chain